MPINGKTADQLREEFLDLLRQDRLESAAAARRREEAQTRFEDDMRQQWAKITGEWGRFNNDEGGMVEYEGVAALRELDELGGMAVDEVVHSLKLAKKAREYDGLIRCPGARVLVEFKRRLTCEAVQKFLDEQLPQFPRDFPEMVNGCALYGAVVGATIDDDAAQLARDNGLFVIRLPANRRVEVLSAEARPRATEAAAP